jgi:hypothetical protein
LRVGNIMLRFAQEVPLPILWQVAQRSWPRNIAHFCAVFVDHQVAITREYYGTYKSPKELTMQIGDTVPLANSGDTQYPLNASAAPGQSTQDDTQAATDSSSLALSPSQDDAVQISPQGQAAASSENDDSAGSASDQTTTESAADANAQPVKSLVYGSLGLERPDQPTDPNQAYSLGRWIAAGITLGGIVSLFI